MEKRDAKAEFLTAFWKLYEKKNLRKFQSVSSARRRDTTGRHSMCITTIFTIF